MLKIIITSLILGFLSLTSVFGEEKKCFEDNSLSKEFTEKIVDSDINKSENQSLESISNLNYADITQCTRTYSRCLDDIIESSENCSYCYPGGSLVHFARVMFCAGRYNDCISNQ